jgi:hypothetical protein
MKNSITYNVLVYEHHPDHAIEMREFTDIMEGRRWFDERLEKYKHELNGKKWYYHADGGLIAQHKGSCFTVRLMPIEII